MLVKVFPKLLVEIKKLLNFDLSGKNGCPDDWTLFGDHCYQFNLAESQFKNWTGAKQACESIGDFSSLVSIQNESENAFLTKEISSVAKSAVWIGLNDRQSENVFKWSDSSAADYRNWIQKNSRNRPWKDCTVLMGMRTDGAWSTELCSAPRRYICKRKKGLLMLLLLLFVMLLVLDR